MTLLFTSAIALIPVSLFAMRLSRMQRQAVPVRVRARR